MAEVETTPVETKTVERLHRSTVKLLDDIDKLNEVYFAEAKKNQPSPARLKALSNAIEVAQASQVRLNFSILRFRDGLHPKQASVVDLSQKINQDIKIGEGRLPAETILAADRLINERLQGLAGGAASSNGINGANS